MSIAAPPTHDGAAITPAAVIPLIGQPHAPLLIDTRRRPAFEAAERMIAGAVWRDHQATADWIGDIRPGEPVTVYCVHGHNVSQAAVASLRMRGIDARYLQGGFDAFCAQGGVTAAKSEILDTTRRKPSRWVTETRPAIQQLACIWLIRRFLDRAAEIHFAGLDWIAEIAAELDATLFGVSGPLATVDALQEHFGLGDGSIARLAGGLPEIAGLWDGLRSVHDDDQQAIDAGMSLLDGLFACYRRAAP